MVGVLPRRESGADAPDAPAGRSLRRWAAARRRVAAPLWRRASAALESV